MRLIINQSSEHWTRAEIIGLASHKTWQRESLAAASGFSHEAPVAVVTGDTLLRYVPRRG